MYKRQTLQTLIVTAVLVLVAGAAGVVIIAITNNASDNLEGQNTGVNSRCKPWEIFDPLLSADGRGKGNGGIESSAIGCLRVCYVEYKHASALTSATRNSDGELISNSTNDITLTDTSAALAAAEGKLLFSWTDETEVLTTAGEVSTLPINGARSVNMNGNEADPDTGHSATIEKMTNSSGDDLTVENLEIRVAANQRYCEVWNNTADQQEFRSKN